MRRILVLGFILASLGSKAQVNAHRDSIKIALKAEPKLFVSLHNRKTFLQSETIQLYGFVGGIDFQQKVKCYVGIYGFGPQNQTAWVNRPPFVNDTLHRHTTAWNLSIGAEYVYHVSGRWMFSVPAQIGIGRLSNTFSKNNEAVHSERFTFVPVEAGANAYLSVLPWVGLKGGVGYRLMLGRSEAFTKSAPYYNLGLTLLIGKIYSDAFN